jgi:hypothetical protein
MANIATQRSTRMWPSFETASSIFDWANWFLLGALAVGVVSTGLVVWMGNVKEAYLRKDLSDARLETARIKKEFGPRNLEWNAFVTALRSAARVQLEILYVADDTDAMELAQQIQLACSAAGWGMPSRNPIQRPPGWSEPLAMAVDGQPRGVTVVSQSPTPADGIANAVAAGLGAVAQHANGPNAPPIGSVRIVVAPKR